MDDKQNQMAKRGFIDECTGGSPKLTHANDGTKMCLALFPNADLIKQLRDTICEPRKTAKIEAETDTELEGLEEELLCLRRNLKSLERAAAAAKEVASQDDPANLSTLRQRVAVTKENIEQNEQQQDQIQDQMNALYNGLRDKQYGFLSILDGLFVKSGLLPAESRSGSEVSGVPNACPLAVRSQSGQPGSGVESTDSNHIDRLIQPTERASHQSWHSPNPMTDTTALDQREDKSTSKDSDRKADLLYHARVMRKLLDSVTYDLDNREEEFDRQAIEHDCKAQAGEKVVTHTELDLHFFRETQRLTRRVIELEEQYEMAKADAVAAGVPLPWSDIESGFVDDANDGYRLSFEQDMQEGLDRRRIFVWLQGMEEAGASAIPNTMDADRRVDLPDEDISIWGDAESVEICDSLSMRAEGSWRKRIDRWKAKCCEMIAES